MKATSHTFSVMRGSVGGITYTANQYAAIVGRQRVSPVNPMTTRQTQIRAAMAEAAIAWKLLSDNQRAAWALYATFCIYNGPTGNYTVSGRDCFIANYSFAAFGIAAGLGSPALPTDAPEVMGFYEIGGLEVSAPSGPGTGIGLTINNYGDQDIFYTIDVSPPMEATRLRYKGPWNSALKKGGTALKSTSTITDVLGLTAGKVYFLRFRAQANDDYQAMCAAFIVRGTASTVP